jgi:hypothetical protein
MANGQKKIVVFVHGWSVHNTDTYGEFPARLEQEVRDNVGLELDIRHIWLGKYVSFRDEVQLQDISRAFETELHHQLGREITVGRRFICITHSTGGPVVRDWLDRYYIQQNRIDACPLSHLIMLAPANFGSALAQLGKARVGRMKAWFDGVEPGSGVLDWLELGSPESLELNQRWFNYSDLATGNRPIFSFVLTGQQIDRALYDYVNSYTGEIGSDGVVRVAAANLNATYVRLEQEEPELIPDSDPPQYKAHRLILKEHGQTQQTAFGLVSGRSHSGEKMGIIRSIINDGKNHPTVTAVLQCLNVHTGDDYKILCEKFVSRNVTILQEELLEWDKHLIRPDKYYIHDPHSMVIVRVTDDHGYIVEDFDLILTGKGHSPERLPQGFLQDKQKNKRNKGTITLFLNHAIMTGCPELKNNKGEVVRKERPDAKSLGFILEPHHEEGLVHYLKCELRATKTQLQNFLRPNQTTLVDIKLRRIVHEGVFRLTRDRVAVDFADDPPGPAI